MGPSRIANSSVLPNRPGHHPKSRTKQATNTILCVPPEKLFAHELLWWLLHKNQLYNYLCSPWRIICLLWWLASVPLHWSKSCYGYTTNVSGVLLTNGSTWGNGCLSSLKLFNSLSCRSPSIVNVRLVQLKQPIPKEFVERFSLLCNIRTMIMWRCILKLIYAFIFSFVIPNKKSFGCRFQT